MSMGGCRWPTARATTNLPLIDEALCGPPLTEVPLSESDSVTLAAVLAALADPVRLLLISILAAQGEVCSCHLQEPLAKSQPTISHHTRVLTQAGLIEGTNAGNGRGGGSSPNASPQSARRSVAPEGALLELIIGRGDAHPHERVSGDDCCCTGEQSPERGGAVAGMYRSNSRLGS